MAEQKFLAKFSGIIVRFTGRGRKLGFPTANIQIDKLLEGGIYFGRADLDKYNDRLALIYVGASGAHLYLEAHLLDITDKDYYGQMLKVRLLHYHRPSRPFDSTKKLVEAIKADETAGRQWFKQQRES